MDIPAGFAGALMPGPPDSGGDTFFPLTAHCYSSDK